MVRERDSVTADRGGKGGLATRGPAAALTERSLIDIDYIAPPAAISDYVTTLYHFRCDEKVIRDIQPASIGHLTLFPRGKGAMHFRAGHSDPNPPVAIMTPLSHATPIVVAGPFHAIGAALSPLGWAALTGLHAGEHRDRMHPAQDLLGPEVAELGEQLNEAYRGGSMSGEDCALELGAFVAGRAKPVKPRHAEFIAVVNAWLATSLDPDIAHLIDAAAYSERQVQRLCEQYFGLPPKKLARKYRALRAAALLSFPKLTPRYEAELGDVFFDQSHMIREITMFVGRTPARLGDGDNPFLSEMLSPDNLRELGG